jgi:hypothetical protein
MVLKTVFRMVRKNKIWTTQRSGDLEIWRSGDLEICGSRDLEIWRSGDLEVLSDYTATVLPGGLSLALPCPL